MKNIDFLGPQMDSFATHRENHFKHKNPYISTFSSLEAIIALIVDGRTIYFASQHTSIIELCREVKMKV